MRRRLKTILGGIAVAILCASCGNEENNKGSDKEPDASKRVLSDSEIGEQLSDQIVPTGQVENNQRIYSEYEALPDAIVEQVPIDDNGNELLSSAQFRAYYGQQRPRTASDAHSYYYRRGQTDHRVNPYGNFAQRDTRYRNGYGHGSHHPHSIDRRHYQHRPHYRSQVQSHYHWVYGQPQRYRSGNFMIYWYPKPLYRYENGHCYNFYRGR